MKAIIKVHVAITPFAEPGDPPVSGEDLKYDIVYAYNGEARLPDKMGAVGFMSALVNYVGPWLDHRCTQVKGDHKPDLALARGGDPEPRSGADGDAPDFFPSEG